MPLLSLTLEDQILRLTDQTRSDFLGFPSTANLVGANWARAARAFFVVASIPSIAILLPVAHDLAESAMSSTVVSLSSTGVLALQNGFAIYAATLAANVLPGAGVVVPPPTPLTLPLLPPVSDPLIPAAVIAASVLAWALTGTFIPATPPGSPPIPWL